MGAKSPPLDLSNAAPQPLGSAAAGTSGLAARADHVHAAPPGVIPSNATPQALGSAAPGVSADYSRADHVHALPTIPAASVVTPLAPTAGGSIGAATAYARADHQHPPQSIPGLTLGSPNSRSVSLATAYQATDNTKPAIVTVNLTSTAALSLSGGTTCTADVLIGSTNAVASGTGSIVGRYINTLAGALVVGLAVNSSAGTPFTLALPAGWFFAVRQTGAGTVTVTSAFDQAVN